MRKTNILHIRHTSLRIYFSLYGEYHQIMANFLLITLKTSQSLLSVGTFRIIPKGKLIHEENTFL